MNLKTLPNGNDTFNEEYLDDNTKKIYNMFIEFKNRM